MGEFEEPEIIAIDSERFPGPGILTVTIHEAIGLSLPSQHDNSFKHPLETGSAHAVSLAKQSKHQSLPYAILEFENSQVTIEATSGSKENPVWERGETKRSSNQTRKFDVFRAAELTIRLYMRHAHANRGSSDISLGIVKTTPFYGHESATQMEWLPIRNGTGKLSVEVQYVKSNALHIHMPWSPRTFEQSRLGHISRTKLSGSDCYYASLTIQKADVSLNCDMVQTLLSPINDNPFIAPLRFIAQTRSKLSLFWPFIPGGHLFYYLQRAHCFQIDRARLYAAEILMALECVHGIDPSYHQLKPKNLLLDSMGHIVLFDIGLFRLETNNMRSTFAIPEEYQAPEVLFGENSASTDTTASKWWTLGAFLFEMLTGLPPFYDENTEHRRHKILSEPLEVPNLLPASAQDLLIKLLSRNPKERLGVNGPSEIRNHPFFNELDWDKVARREYEPAFKPSELAVTFQEQRRLTMEEMMRQFEGFSYNRPIDSTNVSTTVESNPVALKRPVVKPPVVIAEKKEEWDIVWHREGQEFYFYNHVSKIRKAIAPRQSSKNHITKRNSQVISTKDQEDNTSDLPNEAQKQAALEAVLQEKYMHLVPELLATYNMDLNFNLGFARQTPLEYVARIGDVDVVKLFLSHGADATTRPNGYLMGGLPLLYASRRGNHELVKVLIQRTDRVPCTRALGHAVSRRDISMVNTLLSNGVKCDFEASDRPPSLASRRYHTDFWDGGCSFAEDASEPREYTPPLVIAVSLPDLDLIKVLLDHGADVNVGYHDSGMLTGWPSHMDCGRPIQLAMEHEYTDVVRLLLDYGADINLAQPVWEHHECDMVPREAFLQIMSRLRSIAATTRNTRVLP
ncbi:hypothetical protein V8C35DRAFT_305921 [Trichoderma chlorosporum]